MLSIAANCCKKRCKSAAISLQFPHRVTVAMPYLAGCLEEPFVVSLGGVSVGHRWLPENRFGWKTRMA